MRLNYFITMSIIAFLLKKYLVIIEKTINGLSIQLDQWHLAGINRSNSKQELSHGNIQLILWFSDQIDDFVADGCAQPSSTNSAKTKRRRAISRLSW